MPDRSPGRISFPASRTIIPAGSSGSCSTCWSRCCLMEIGVYKTLEHTLALYSNVAVAWVGALVADLVIVRPLGLRPRTMEFKRAHLYDINPVGVGAMRNRHPRLMRRLLRSVRRRARAPRSLRVARRRLDRDPRPRLRDGRTVLHRPPARTKLASACAKSNAAFASTNSMPKTWRSCPAYAGPICSLCCSLDARCQRSLQAACADERADRRCHRRSAAATAPSSASTVNLAAISSPFRSQRASSA